MHMQSSSQQQIVMTIFILLFQVKAANLLSKLVQGPKISILIVRHVRTEKWGRLMAKSWIKELQKKLKAEPKIERQILY